MDCLRGFFRRTSQFCVCRMSGYAFCKYIVFRLVICRLHRCDGFVSAITADVGCLDKQRVKCPWYNSNASADLTNVLSAEEEAPCFVHPNRNEMRRDDVITADHTSAVDATPRFPHLSRCSWVAMLPNRGAYTTKNIKPDRIAVTSSQTQGNR